MINHLSSFPMGWNRRILTLDDFYAQAEKENIIVREADIGTPGAYIRLCNHIIFLSSNLTTWKKALVAWHEYAHFKLHPPGRYHYLGERSKAEEEAQIFATCALVPEPFCQSGMDVVESEYGYPEILLKYRYWIYDRYGF